MTSGLDLNRYAPYLEALKHLCLTKSITIATAESCTGGLLATIFTESPGSSAFYVGGVCAYSNWVKTELLGVEAATIERHGAVSKETALAMATRVQSITGAKIGVAVTGIAGPDGGTADKPVGTVWWSLKGCHEARAKTVKLSGNRSQVRAQTAERILKDLVQELEKGFL